MAGEEIVLLEDGCIVTKKEDEYCILLYSIVGFNELKDYNEIFKRN